MCNSNTLCHILVSDTRRQPQIWSGSVIRYNLTLLKISDRKFFVEKKLHLDNSDYMQNLEHYQLSCNLECDSDKSQIKQRLKDWGRLFTQRKQTIVWFETHQFYDFHTCLNQQGFVLSWNWRMHLKVLRLHCFLNVSSDYMYLKHPWYSTNQNITLKMRRARYGISKS